MSTASGHRWGYLDEYYDQFLGQFVDQKDALLVDAVDLHIELNAVIFADGTLVRPDDESMWSILPESPADVWRYRRQPTRPAGAAVSRTTIFRPLMKRAIRLDPFTIQQR